MNSKSLIRCGCLVAVTASALLATSTHADTPAFPLGTVFLGVPTSLTGTLGWPFVVYGENEYITITQLGVFDSGGDGLVNPHQVGLWRDDGTLLTSATVPAGTAAALFDGYRYVPIPPVNLNRLERIIIAAQYSAADADDLVKPSPLTDRFGAARFAPEIFHFPYYGSYGYGSELPYPDLHTTPPCEGCSAERFWQPNFQYMVVPEPSVWLLLLAGMFCLLFRYRKTC